MLMFRPTGESGTCLTRCVTCTWRRTWCAPPPPSSTSSPSAWTGCISRNTARYLYHKHVPRPGSSRWPPRSCTASTGTTPRPPGWSSSCAGPPASPSASPSCAASTTDQRPRLEAGIFPSLWTSPGMRLLKRTFEIWWNQTSAIWTNILQLVLAPGYWLCLELSCHKFRSVQGYL